MAFAEKAEPGSGGLYAAGRRTPAIKNKMQKAKPFILAVVVTVLVVAAIFRVPKIKTLVIGA